MRVEQESSVYACANPRWPSTRAQRAQRHNNIHLPTTLTSCNSSKRRGWISSKDNSIRQSMRPGARARQGQTTQQPSLAQAILKDPQERHRCNVPPPSHKIPRVPSQTASSLTKQARNQRVVIRTPARRAIGGVALCEVDLPAPTTVKSETSINLTVGHSRRHPAEATKPSSKASLSVKNEAKSKQTNRHILQEEK